MNYKKFIGGNYNINDKIKNLIAITIVGYFGIKIVYASFFNFYPKKYYQRNIQINSNETCLIGEENNSATKSITLNAFVPGVWNNELTDFITLIVLVFIICIFTNFSDKNFTDSNNNLNFIFLAGFIIGLGYPVIKNNYLGSVLYADESLIVSDDDNNIKVSSNYLIGFILLLLLIIIGINFIENNDNSRINYFVYISSIILILFGLMGTRKKSENYSTVSYFDNSGQSCTFNSKNNKDLGIIKSSSENIRITIPFLSFIFLLLFSNEPKNPILTKFFMFLYSLLLGILVSAISYYGIPYFLYKVPLKECNNLKQCIVKKINSESEYNDYLSNEENYNMISEEFPSESNENNSNTSNSSNSSNKKNINILNLILLISLILVIIYLIFYFFRDKI